MLRTTQISMLLLVTAMITTSVLADYPDTYIPKFIQAPQIELQFGDAVNPDVYYGHDEESTAYLVPGTTNMYQGIFMADDFADKIDQPVAHVQWWGSYMVSVAPMNQQVQQFLISFERDVPAIGGQYSHPGEVLSSQIVTIDTTGGIPAPGNFTERSIHPGGPPLNEELFLYNAELAVPFPQEKDKVYWLKIVALVDPNDPDQDGIVWGWHNRDYTKDNLATASPMPIPGEYIQGSFNDSAGNLVDVWHFQDDAVTGWVDIVVDTDPATGEELIQVDQTTLSETYYRPGLDFPDYVTEPFSKDLAFALYAVPEPATVSLLVLGGLMLLRRRRRRKTA